MKKCIKNVFLLSFSLLLLVVSGCKFNSPEPEEINPVPEQEALPTNFTEFLTALGNVDYSIKGNVTSTKDEVYTGWEQYGKALLPDTHGDVIKICYIERDKYGYHGVDSSFAITGIAPETESYLVFDYKYSLYTYVGENESYPPKPYDSEKCVSIYVNGEKQTQSYGFMGNSVWRTTGIKLSAGSVYSVEWCISWLDHYSTFFKNCIYLDNFRLVPEAEYKKVQISPLGKQETFINKPLNFTASANWTDAAPVFSASDGASITPEGVFTASQPGTYTVTATIDGKSASNSTVVVYDDSYFNSPVTTAGKTFKGKLDDTSTTPYTDNTKGLLTLSDQSPQYSAFNADGFFILKGTVNDTSKDYYITTIKLTDGHRNTSYTTSYPVKGSFTQRIWLRFGDGDYEVHLATYENNQLNSKGLLYNVNCTIGLSVNQANYTLPSAIVTSDSFAVSNAVNDALYYYPDATDGVKLQLFHDWIMHNFHYDYVSLDNSKRKSQYSDFCITNKLAVCEGYADVFAAMARYCNIPCSIICTSADDMNHAWNQVYYNDEWKLVDVTWDDTYYDPDQSVTNTDKRPYEENYTYFMIDLKGINNDHVDKFYQGEMNRTLNKTDITPPYFTDMPNGWY